MVVIYCGESRSEKLLLATELKYGRLKYRVSTLATKIQQKYISVSEIGQQVLEKKKKTKTGDANYY